MTTVERSRWYSGWGVKLTTYLHLVLRLKTDSHIACRAHAVSLIHTCNAAPLPCSDSAVTFVKARVVAGNIRTASPTV